QGLRDTTSNLAHTLEEVTGRANAAGEEIGSQTSQMERMSGLMVGELRDFSRHLSTQIDQLSEVTGNLNSEASEFGRGLQGMESNVVQTVRQSIDQLTSINHDIAHTIERATLAS